MHKENRKQRGKIKENVILPQAEMMTSMPKGYADFMVAIKARISTQKVKTFMNANVEMILLYWHIGFAILDKQSKESWGTKVIDRMSHDLKVGFPDMGGFSPRNLKYMRKFAEAWPDIAIVQRCVAQIPWRSNITLLDKLNNYDLRLWYAQKVLENGMGKDMLVYEIESGLHLREGATISNFKHTLPSLNSDLVQQSFKDPYIFDFLGTDAPKREMELEQKLIDHIQRFLLELGQGFAFVGRQVHLELGDSDFYHETDHPTIGLLLVKEKNKLIVEYSLINNSNPVGVANWENTVAKNLPETLKASLPTIEEIESELKEDLTDA